jgi:hypothetical protein
MKNAGTSLRKTLKKKFDTDLLCKASEQFTALQITVTDHVNDFINIGVPDWRLNKLPEPGLAFFSVNVDDVGLKGVHSPSFTIIS